MSNFASVSNGAFRAKRSVFTRSLAAVADCSVAVDHANPMVEDLVSKNFSGRKYTRMAANVRRAVPAVSRSRALAMGIE